ncbi:MAG: hypothetical protein LBO65_01490 [Spirochaetaceae bacterium]|jgi:hypothetical protein|nr:hypothetical protein [Spirochaetaceae bacterium]
MYEHPKLRAFTNTLDALFREVDDFLEEEWGAVYALHPNRPARGATGNPEMDGLFEVAADFSPGIGSRQGRGYIVSFRAATLESIPPEQFEFLMEEAAHLVGVKLPRFFPGRDLRVVRDGKRFKIVGDFSLGEV